MKKHKIIIFIILTVILITLLFLRRTIAESPYVCGPAFEEDFAGDDQLFLDSTPQLFFEILLSNENFSNCVLKNLLISRNSKDLLGKLSPSKTENKIEYISAIPIVRSHYIGDEIHYEDIQVEAHYTDGSVVCNPSGWSAHIIAPDRTISTKYLSTENFVIVCYEGFFTLVGIVAFEKPTPIIAASSLNNHFSQADLNYLYAVVYQEIGICNSTSAQRMNIISVIFNRYSQWAGGQGPLVGRILGVVNQIWLKNIWNLGYAIVPASVTNVPADKLQIIMAECEYVWNLYITTGHTTNNALYWHVYQKRPHWWNDGKSWLGTSY